MVCEESFNLRNKGDVYDVDLRNGFGGAVRSKILVHTVLVVDDEPSVLDVMAIMLGELGCEVLTAGNAREALATLAADRNAGHRIHMLLTDINMPGMNGYELAEKAKAAHADLEVVAMSGGTTGDGSLPMIRKPLRLHDLQSAMRRVWPH
jgi:CheY-like chemotaxis protein